MIPKIEFQIDSSNNLIIKDTTIYDDPSNPGVSFSSYKKLDSGSIFVLGYHNKNNEIEYIAPFFVNCHNNTDKYKIFIPKDGWITLYHVILPTGEYIDTFSPEEMEGVVYGYYICDGKIYDRNHKDENNRDKEVDLKEVIEGNSDIATTAITSQDYVTIFYLQKCFINICKDIFDNAGANGGLSDAGACFKSKSDNTLISRRDIIWMAINVIKYLVKYNMKAEATRIINQLEGCNGICTQTSNYKNVQGCGCGN